MKEHVTDVGAFLREEKLKGSWKLVYKGAKIFRSFYEVRGELEKGPITLWCTMAVSNPIFWFISVASFALSGVFALIAALVMLVL